MKTLLLLFLSALAFAAGCAAQASSSPSASAQPTPAVSAQPSLQPVATSAPSVASLDTWSWLDVPESRCGDGTPTGAAFNVGTAPDILMVYFEGGGACWDATMCSPGSKSVIHTSYHQSDFTHWVNAGTIGILRRELVGNAINLVDIPYCTGDLHGGNNVATYAPSSGAAFPFYHYGHVNAVADLKRILTQWPNPRKVYLIGTSAGGYGASLNYDTYRAAYPNAKVYLVDDSGPLLENGGVPQPITDQWFANWNLGALLDPLCACRTGLGALTKAMIVKYPSDRMSLLSNLQDSVVSAYMGITAAQMQQALTAIATDVYNPSQHAKYFYVTGTGHTFLAGPPNPNIVNWLTQEVNDDPNWASLST